MKKGERIGNWSPDGKAERAALRLREAHEG